MFVKIFILSIFSVQFYQGWQQGGRHHLRRRLLVRKGGSAYYYYIDRKRVDRLLRGRNSFIANYDSNDTLEPRAARFGISKPKPWRKDDQISIRANKAAEVPADLDDTTLEMKSKPRMVGRILTAKQRKVSND